MTLFKKETDMQYYSQDIEIFSMTVDSFNISSIREIEKAGFEKSGQVVKKCIFKIYHISE